MSLDQIQIEKVYARDPVTRVILGAEPFEYGNPSESHAILFLHGFTSSPRELRFLAEKMASQNFYCQGLLFKGHGLTLQDLSTTRFSDYYAQSEIALVALLKRHHRVSICGLSMGGLVGLNLALHHAVTGLLLIAPFLKPWGRTLGFSNDFLIGKVPLWGNISKKVGGAIDDPIAVKDHIAYHAMPVKAMVSVVEAAHDFRGKAMSILCPTLIHHAVNDKTSDFSGSVNLLTRLGSLDKTLKVYNRGNHVITLDWERKEVESGLVSWQIQHGHS